MRIGAGLFEWLQREMPQEIGAGLSQPLPAALSARYTAGRYLRERLQLIGC